MENPLIIPDVEIVPDTVNTAANCIGTKKYGRFVMISISHSHGNNTAKGFKGKGFADIILTKDQAQWLYLELKNRLRVITDA